MKIAFHRSSMQLLAIAAFSCCVSSGLVRHVHADVKLPNVFSDHMVLQQGQENRIWGTATAGESVSISIADKSIETKADAKGYWETKLPSMKASSNPIKLTIKGSSVVEINDILVGEVWICSGQSNMQWAVASSNDADLEKLTSNFPNIRMINFPQIGTQDPIWSHDDRKWMVSGPNTVLFLCATNSSDDGYTDRHDQQRLGWLGRRSMGQSRFDEIGRSLCRTAEAMDWTRREICSLVRQDRSQ